MQIFAHNYPCDTVAAPEIWGQEDGEDDNEVLTRSQLQILPTWPTAKKPNEKYQTYFLKKGPALHQTYFLR